jgi:cellulose synthase operon protein C
MASVLAQESLPAASAGSVFRAWVSRYPKEPEAWRRLIGHLTAGHQFAAAETEIAAFAQAFPGESEPVRMRAALELERGATDAALAIYDRAFRPLQPEPEYFKLLQKEGRLHEFSSRARAALAKNPADLDATSRLFQYFRQQNNPAAARRVLLQYRIAKESGKQQWTADELETGAQLFEQLPDVNEAARLYYALYAMPPAGGPQQERALASLADLLLTESGQPIQFGTGDLSFYQDIATADSSPGFLNGILSLILNGSSIRWQYQEQSAKSAAYFRRSAGTRLVALLDQRFPRSPRREGLHAAVIAAYAAYGDDASVIRDGRQYLTEFPKGESRFAVAMQISDALARGGRVNEEFAIYDQLLKELAANASGVPIGDTPPRNPSAASSQGARSTGYVQVLDKYLARLAALNRPMDALRVYRAEIDRNPNDPGLYQRFAGYLEQNGMSRDVEQVYTRAIAQFPDRSWYHKLARWYLRTRQSRELETLSRQVIAIFSGADLERYFGDIVSATHPDAVLYRQLNLYAHERFPEDLVFVRNLLNAYRRPETASPAAADRLLRQYWFYDAGLRAQLFQSLSQQGRLYPELSEIRAANPGIVSGQFDQALVANPAAVQFDVEAETWLSHFEAAAPAVRALAAAYPGEREFADKGASLYRSLAAYDPRHTETALALAGYRQKADPLDTATLARMGDILADRDLFVRARTYWDRMPLVRPASQEGYLDAATVYWDYYLYGDALRWISAARRKFGKPALFAYQAGAIGENLRDYNAAIREYVAGALAGDPPSRSRLLRLLDRPQFHAAIDRATVAALSAKATPEAVSLRIDVLVAGKRRPELEGLLSTRVEAENSAAELTALQQTAREQGFDRIEERAVERLATLTNDPVDQMRLTLDRMRLLESKKQVVSAAAVADALYRDHPLILGVVRGAVDFHVRNSRYDDAIRILLDARQHARPDLSAQFTLEAARVATTAREFDRARTLLSSLLTADPIRAEYLAAMADTYLQANDDRGFRDFQVATINRLKSSPLSPADRVSRIAAIRRSLIPALDRLHDTAGAVDQYIEVVNSYPDDESVAKEAATYALQHGQADRLTSFYRKTIAGAPRDYRWPIVLGRIETVSEDYPAAVAAYDAALRNRPDRADVLQAKARLEERLMRFADALKSYTRLYDLTYRDPQWMVKVAELQARSGANAAAVAALRTAIIGARTETADADFAIAQRLEEWHILPDAVSFAERGASRAGADLFRTYENAQTYCRILARARRMDLVLPRLENVAGHQSGVATAAGKVIAETYTPEDKAALARLLATRAASLQRDVRDQSLLPLVDAAGLVDLAAEWRAQSMSDQRLATLEAERGVYGEWGRILEASAAANTGQPAEGAALRQAAIAFRNEGDTQSEIRVLAKALARNELQGPQLDRYFQLTIDRPDVLLALARSGASSEIRNQAVQFAIGAGLRESAYNAVRARGGTLTPAWTNAFTALTGVYFDDHVPAIDTAFQTVLDTRTIGERLAAPRKSDVAILGSIWFYYGARYGEYLDRSHRAEDSEVFLPSTVEGSPQSASAYIALGDWYAGAGQPAKALDRYAQALELDPDRGDAHDHAARLLWSLGRKPEAVARWKAAIATFVRIQSRGVRVPEPFWGSVAEAFTDIGEKRALADLRGDMAQLLADYERRNGQYRFRELFEPAARASLASGNGLGWLVSTAQSTSEPEAAIGILTSLRELTDAQRISLVRDQVALAEQRVESLTGNERGWAEDRLVNLRVELIAHLLDAGDVNGATAEWRRLPAPAAPRNRWERNEAREIVDIRVAAASGTLATLFDRFRAHPESAPYADVLRSAATQLRKSGDSSGARSVLAFLYERELANSQLEPANFLGLAQVRLEENNTAAALALLNRMALVLDDGFETLTRSAELLEQHGKRTEAAAFLKRRIQAAPWDSEAKERLAVLQPAGAERDGLFRSAVADGQAPYRVRTAAARLAGPQSGAPAGTELALLSAPRIPPADASKPYFVESRIEAAHQISDPQTQLALWRAALAVAPADPRVRVGAVRAALAARRDSLALAIEQATKQNSDTGLADPERAALAESLAAAAARLDDLATAIEYLRAVNLFSPPDARAALQAKLDALTAERDRRSRNSARQPAIRDVIDQDHAVEPLERSAQ